MIQFWLPAALLLTLAAAFVLVPLLRARDPVSDTDRAALNVALYGERLQALQAQRQSGLLTQAQFDAARAEAARALLADTAGQPAPAARGKAGMALALAAALLVPAGATALYWRWGALDQVLQAQQYAGHANESIEHMTARLEAALAAAPETPEAWFFLGRTYMAQDRWADAAGAFEQAVIGAGRPPEWLGHWAQALYFAGDQQWTPQLQALVDEALAGDPEEAASLTLAGIAAFESGRYADAAAYWDRLAATLPAGDPTRDTVMTGVARARSLAGSPAAPPP